MSGRIIRFTSLALLLVAMAHEITAQESGTVLLLQPGMMSADFLSAPEGEPSTTGFNLRFSAVVTTRWRLINPVVGASVTPYGTSGGSRRNTNTPVLFAGNVATVLPSSITAGWVALEIPVLLTYTFGGGGRHNPRLYGRDVAVQSALTVHVGRKMLRDFGGSLSRLRLYAILEQSLTPNRRPAQQDLDRFNPIAYYGLTIPIGSGREP